MTKQYLLLCTEEGRKTIAAFARGVDFIEVQGVSFNNESKMHLLATPVASITEVCEDQKQAASDESLGEEVVK